MAPNHQHETKERTAALRRRAAHEATATAETPPAHPLLTLQRQLGNAQVSRMLAQREEAPEEEELQARRDPALQREEAPEEEELQARRDPALQREEAPEEEELQAQRDPALQREEAPEEEEIQAKPEVGMAGGPISEGLASRINAQRGGGSSLDENTRTQMENSFGASFADVRIHTGSESQQLNRSVGAKAFTTGNDIFFGPNGNPADQNLLAHELTHVVQQRSMNHSGPMTVGPAGDHYEQEADSVAAAVNTGAAPATPQRKEDNA